MRKLNININFLNSIIICLFLIQFVSNGLSLNIECLYKEEYFWINGLKYCCSVQNTLNITTRENSKILRVSEYLSNSRQDLFKSDNEDDEDDFSGDHSTMSLNQIYIKITNKIVNYFPQNLHAYFENIKGVQISNSHLKEISQDDLKPFVELEFLSLDKSDIEIITEDLFLYNPKLRVINLENSKFFAIETLVFSNLNNLHSINIQPCLSDAISNNATAVKLAPRQIRIECILTQATKLVNKKMNFIISTMENIKINTKNLYSNPEIKLIIIAITSVVGFFQTIIMVIIYKQIFY